jgi:hypothetical protein
MRRFLAGAVIAMVIAMLPVSPATASGSPTMTLNTSVFFPPSAICDAVGSHNHTVTVAGKGFHPGRGYDLTYAGVYAGHVKADSSGSFTAVVTDTVSRPVAVYLLDATHGGRMIAESELISGFFSCLQMTGPSGGVHTWLWDTAGVDPLTRVDFWVGPDQSLAQPLGAHKRSNNHGFASIVFSAACPPGMTGNLQGWIRDTTRGVRRFFGPVDGSVNC